MANPTEKEIDFSTFIENTKAASHASFAANKIGMKTDPIEFEKMRQYLLERNEGMVVQHSYVDEGGVIWDCVPFKEHPAVKKWGQEIKETVVSTRENMDIKRSGEPVITAQIIPNQKDKDIFGNSTQCPEGMVPIHRITLSTLTNFRTLNDFWTKGPRNEITDSSTPEGFAHRYAVASQEVNNNGAGCTLYVCQPNVDISKGEIFSLAQMWITGGEGNALQTLECGWHVYPALWGNAFPHLFTLWTPDNYVSGKYNNWDYCFVPTPGSPYWLGMSLLANENLLIEFVFQPVPWYFNGILKQAGWYLYVDQQEVGYFPIGIFKNGQLSKMATYLEFGGEVCSFKETDSFAPMGTGILPYVLNQNANVNLPYYINTETKGKNFTKTTIMGDTAPACYKTVIGTEPNFGMPYQTIYYGGPGGTGCGTEK